MLLDDRLSDMVIQAIMTATDPILERLAISEALLEMKTAEMVPVLASVVELMKENGVLRERVVMLETKAEIFHAPDSVDLSPILERLAVAEVGIVALTGVPERLMAVETKAALPMPVVDLGDVPARLSAAELKLEFKAQTVDAIVSTLADHTKDLGAMRERTAVLETRAPEPGPVGKAGEPGKDGKNATVDNIKVVRRSERFIEFCFKDDVPIEGGLIKLNHPVFKAPFVKESDYDEGDIVQFGSAGWIAIKDKPSGIPGQGSKEITGWQLFNKPGRDGKDLRPEGPPPALPVVKVGGSR